MSYCRWSSSDWKCDVYCYEDVNGGYTTHVAGSRITSHVTPCDYSTPEAMFATHTQQMKDLESATREKIGLSRDGETFNDGTLEEFRDRLKSLKDEGYTVPDYVFESIEEEMLKPTPPEKD